MQALEGKPLTVSSNNNQTSMIRLIFLELYIGDQFYIQFLLACIDLHI